MTVFGRDTLIVSLQIDGDRPGAWRAPRCARWARSRRGRRPREGRRAGQDPARDALRQGRGADRPVPVLRLGRSTPLFLIVLGETWRWTRRRRDRARARADRPAARWPGWRGPATRRRRLPGVPPPLGARPRGAVLEGLLELDAVPRRHAGAQPARGVRGAGLRVRGARCAWPRSPARPGTTRRSPTGWSATRPRCGRASTRVLGRARRPRLLRARARRRQAAGRRLTSNIGAPALHRHRAARAHRGDRARARCASGCSPAGASAAWRSDERRLQPDRVPRRHRLAARHEPHLLRPGARTATATRPSASRSGCSRPRSTSAGGCPR